MVTLKSAPRDPDVVGELDQLVIRVVAHEMTPLPTLEPPAGFIDQDCHPVECATPCNTRGVSLDQLWTLHVAEDPTLLTRLLSRYRERHRRYHTAEHLTAVVSTVVDLAPRVAVDDLDAVVAAAFYHDAIYEPASPANERASARLARRDLAALGWGPDRAGRVGEMIEETTNHLDPSDDDAALLFDADLAILGAPPSVYDTYALDVRADYRRVDDGAWRSGRAAVLASFLERPSIFTTAPGQARCESAARANLARELAALSG